VSALRGFTFSSESSGELLQEAQGRSLLGHLLNDPITGRHYCSSGAYLIFASGSLGDLSSVPLSPVSPRRRFQNFVFNWQPVAPADMRRRWCASRRLLRAFARPAERFASSQQQTLMEPRSASQGAVTERRGMRTSWEGAAIPSERQRADLRRSPGRHALFQLIISSPMN
jgi:hypothetical protein